MYTVHSVIYFLEKVHGEKARGCGLNAYENIEKQLSSSNCKCEHKYRHVTQNNDVINAY